MSERHARVLLRDLQKRRVAPHGEAAVDVERSPELGDTAPEPVLLLTDAALYAARAGSKTWSRLPFEHIRRITVHTDPTGMLTRYEIQDDEEQLWFAAALPMARPSFRERMHDLAARLPHLRRQQPAVPAAAVMTSTSVARLAALASARSMVSSAAMVSASSITPVAARPTRVA